MSVRFSFRRTLFSMVCLLSLGAAGYTVIRKPFKAARIKAAVLEAAAGEMQDIHWEGDREAVRVCEELIADSHGHERLSRQSLEIVIRVLHGAKSEALAPALRKVLQDWNRGPQAHAQDEETALARVALQTLLDLDIPSAKQALAELEQEFPPFPRPYHVALPAYVWKGKHDEAIALATRIVDHARRISDASAPGWTESRVALGDVLGGLKEIAQLSAANDLLWAIFEIQFVDGNHLVWINSLAEHDPDQFVDELLRRLPEIPMISESQASLFAMMSSRYRQQPTVVAAAFERLLAQAGHDLRKIHWLKKLALLEILRVQGTTAELPLLRRFAQDESAVRTLERRRGDGRREEVKQDAGAPIPPECEVLRTRTFRELAEKAEASIGKQMSGREKTGR